MKEETLEVLKEIFTAVFELPVDVDHRQVSQSDTDAWDSLGHVSLVTALESEFEVQIPVEDSIEMSSFDVVVEILDELLAE